MSDKLSQEDIDNLLKGNNSPEPAKEAEKNLSDQECDALGEIGNISMGTAATTLSMLLGNKVEITTPQVKEYDNIKHLTEVKGDYVSIEIKYNVGLSGSSFFILRKKDTAIIADLMMGGDGKVKDPEIGELQLSAVGEAMNQMIGTSATSLSSMLNTPIDISSPLVNFHEEGTKIELSQEVNNVPIICIAFKLKVGDLINSEMIQIMSIEAAKSQISRLMNTMNSMMNEVASQVSVSAPQPAPVAAAPSPQPASQQQPAPQMYAAPEVQIHENPVTVQPVQFTSFNDNANIFGESGRNLDLLMDVKLKLTVELGRTELPIKKVLELTRGSIIELDKIAGEPVELYANGKLIAKGEVVVIEDNFGLRITSIVSPDNRIKNL